MWVERQFVFSYRWSLLLQLKREKKSYTIDLKQQKQKPFFSLWKSSRSFEVFFIFYICFFSLKELRHRSSIF